MVIKQVCCDFKFINSTGRYSFGSDKFLCRHCCDPVRPVVGLLLRKLGN